MPLRFVVFAVYRAHFPRINMDIFHKSEYPQEVLLSFMPFVDLDLDRNPRHRNFSIRLHPLDNEV